MNALLALSLTLGVVGIVMTGLHSKAVLRAAYHEGRREGIKEARWVVKVQGISSAHVAPAGNLPLGLVRAQVCHQLEISIGNLLEEQS